MANMHFVVQPERCWFFVSMDSLIISWSSECCYAMPRRYLTYAHQICVHQLDEQSRIVTYEQLLNISATNVCPAVATKVVARPAQQQIKKTFLIFCCWTIKSTLSASFTKTFQAMVRKLCCLVWQTGRALAECNVICRVAPCRASFQLFAPRSGEFAAPIIRKIKVSDESAGAFGARF